MYALGREALALCHISQCFVASRNLRQLTLTLLLAGKELPPGSSYRQQNYPAGPCRVLGRSLVGSVLKAFPPKFPCRSATLASKNLLQDTPVSEVSAGIRGVLSLSFPSCCLLLGMSSRGWWPSKTHLGILFCFTLSLAPALPREDGHKT